MKGASKQWSDHGREEQRIRESLFADARGANRQAATAALRSFWRIYRFRLPLEEARLGLRPEDLNGGQP